MSEKRNSNLLGKVTILIFICYFSLSAYGKYGGGSGTKEDPYQIWDANHMQAIGINFNDWNRHFKLMADLDLGRYIGTSYNIIGNVTTEFTGVFDGNGHTISNFTYDSNDRNCIGLFGYIDDRGGTAEIKDLGLIDVNINAGTGIHVGSLVGRSVFGTISGCYVNGGSVSGNSYVGGLAGSTGFQFIPPPPNPPVTRVTNCYAIVDVTGDGNSIGGLIGRSDYIGISDCYAAGNTVSSGNDVGGLVGYNWRGIVINCYSAGSVEGENNVGGLVGINLSHSSISNCFWDIDTQTHGVTGSIGQNNGTATNVLGLSTSQMQTRSTFIDAGWDFINVWNIGENQTYPYLRTYLPSDINKDGIVNFLDIAITANQWMEEQ